MPKKENYVRYQNYLGPDCLELTILKIIGKISVVIYSLEFVIWICYVRNSWFFACYLDKKNCYLKIASCRWLNENNRLLFSVTGIDDQGLKYKVDIYPLLFIFSTSIITYKCIMFDANQAFVFYSKFVNSKETFFWSKVFWLNIKHLQEWNHFFI